MMQKPISSTRVLSNVLLLTFCSTTFILSILQRLVLMSVAMFKCISVGSTYCNKILDVTRWSKFFQFRAVFGKMWQNHVLAASEGWRTHLEEILDLPLGINNSIVILFSIITPECLQMMKYALKIENKKSSINQSIFFKENLKKKLFSFAVKKRSC